MKSNKLKHSLLAIAASVCIVGCGVGMQPSGPSPAEIEAHKASLPPQEQIQLIQGSPMKPDEKAAKIAEIEQKYGIKANAAAPRSGAN